jgi:GTP diphosphokinase / guanosine-3',5'-bis(diphosphate) 3'-diphosphatase
VRSGVSVHRTDRTNAASLQHQSERIIDVQWAPSPSSVFLVAIRVLADEKLNILSASVTTSDDRVAISRFTFEMGDPAPRPSAQRCAQRQGVYDVYGVTSAA